MIWRSLWIFFQSNVIERQGQTEEIVAESLVDVQTQHIGGMQRCGWINQREVESDGTLFSVDVIV